MCQCSCSDYDSCLNGSEGRLVYSREQWIIQEPTFSMNSLTHLHPLLSSSPLCTSFNLSFNSFMPTTHTLIDSNAQPTQGSSILPRLRCKLQQKQIKIKSSPPSIHWWLHGLIDLPYCNHTAFVTAQFATGCRYSFELGSSRLIKNHLAWNYKAE